MNKIIGYFLTVALFFISVGSHPVFGQSYEIDYCNPPANTQLRTALGCIESTPGGIAEKLFSISLGIAGGVALLMILLGAMQIQMSAGDPERVNGGREIVEGAITGLLLIIFAVFILKVIGVDILSIPGFQ